MGAKQSGPAAANGRTRAYSGSDLPSSSSSGGANGTAGGGARAAAAGRFPAQVPSAHQPSASGGAAAASAAPRSRSLGGAVGTVASGARAAQSTFSIPNSSSGPYGSQDSVHSSPEDGGSSGGRDRPASGGPGGPRLVIGSLPAHLSPHMFGGFKCPVSLTSRCLKNQEDTKICLWKNKNKMQARSARYLSSVRLSNAEVDNHIGNKSCWREDNCHRTQCTRHAFKGHTGILKMLHIP
uniref:Zinc and ring finger 2 n=1 Tax=Ovis aries TaxID=9940 RepID=A0AC11E8U0_SHEEP